MMNFITECVAIQRRLVEDTKCALSECQENLRWKIYTLLGRGVCMMGYRETALCVDLTSNG